jgi:zinc protease
LYDEAREKRGLAYVVGSGFDPLQYRGPFAIEILTKSASVSECKTLAAHLLKQFIESGPTASQLVAAKKNLAGAFPLSLASNRGILNALTNVAFYHRPLNYFDTYVDNVNAVTADQVKRAFQKNIDVGKMATVVVGQSS